MDAKQLEVAVLDRRRKGRTFRRITGPSLITLLENIKPVADKDLGDVDSAPPGPAEDKPTISVITTESGTEAAKDEAAKDKAAKDDPAEPADDTNGDGS